MKKLFGCILSLVMAVMLVFTPAEHVYAQGLGLSVSSSSVAVGKTVKVTVSMPSGYFGTVVISSSDEGVPVSYTHLDVYKRQVRGYDIYRFS